MYLDEQYFSKWTYTSIYMEICILVHEQIHLYEKITDSYRSTNASKSTDTSRSIKADAFWWTYESILQWTNASTKWKNYETYNNERKETSFFK